MTWTLQNEVTQRTQALSEYLEGNTNIAQLARQHGVSRKTMNKWIARYRAGGWEALHDGSRAPHHQAAELSEEIVLAILKLKKRWPLWGAPKIHHKLREQRIGKNCPVESTVGAVLQRHGLTRAKKKRRRATVLTGTLPLKEGANEQWCMDFKGWFHTGNGDTCTPLTITDAHSRYLLCCQGLGGSTAAVVIKPLLIEVFRTFGMPHSILSDNGPPFASTGLAGLSALSVWWMRLGIEVRRIEPGHPEQNGRHERMHRTLKQATASPPRSSLRAQQKAFDEFVKQYNEERPHEGLKQEVPASHYTPSTRPYPLRMPMAREYPEEWERRRVRKAGQAKWQGKWVNVSRALRGESIGFEPRGKGRWGVWFEHLELGQYEERTGKIKAMAKPVKKRRRPKVVSAPKPEEEGAAFGTRLSPDSLRSQDESLVPKEEAMG